LVARRVERRGHTQRRRRAHTQRRRRACSRERRAHAEEKEGHTEREEGHAEEKEEGRLGQAEEVRAHRGEGNSCTHRGPSVKSIK
jgi:hypothetical protein